MNRSYTLVAALTLFLSSLAWAQYNFVLDIDGTLAEEVQPHAAAPDSQLIHLKDGRTFFLFDGLSEFILVLSQISDARVSFFSAGYVERNVELVELILRRAFGGQYESIKDQFKIYSRSDLTDRIPYCPERVFSRPHPVGFETGSKRKNLLIISPDLESTLLVDDSPEFALDGQEENFLEVESSTQAYLNTQARTHLFKALGMIVASVELSQTKHISLRRAFQDSLRLHSGEEFQERGLSVIGSSFQVDPSL